jgi:hypothetical protein
LLWQGAIPLTVGAIWLRLHAAPTVVGAWISAGQNPPLLPDIGRYPFRSWNAQGRGALNLHGHSHGRLKAMPRQYDVGVDAQDFAPVTLTQLLAGGRKEASHGR